MSIKPLGINKRISGQYKCMLENLSSFLIPLVHSRGEMGKMDYNMREVENAEKRN